MALLVSVLLALALYALDRIYASQQRVQQSEQRYRLLAENVHDVIWTLDTDFRFTYVSPSGENLSGFTSEEVLGLPLDKVLMPAAYAIAAQAFQEELAAASTAWNGRHCSRTLELKHLRKDGTTVWGEVNTTLIYDADHYPVGILGVSRDITERKQAEAERALLLQTIQAQARRVQQIVDTVPEGVLLIDADGKVALVNPAARRCAHPLGQSPVDQAVHLAPHGPVARGRNGRKHLPGHCAPPGEHGRT